MKASLLLLLMCASAASMADEKAAVTAQQQPAVEQYTYSMNLDVAKVISVSEVSSGCEAAPVRMNYLDSAGKQHIVEYLMMGTGCSNG
ncbi:MULTISPECIES: DUF2790 domain-containing protein [unclassified Pseudomonas]|uniref:DUF2790 domain-containing protein n=1 Tax=unclassified Pseudomonas TaxID=196821 RepID=UPI002AC9BAE2|nr:MULTISPECIES: DUF2790 domain-containing protein [unclassified Pseudomonas]MEB0042999.1 DUF2790 domain-containing protein [Pseudomonas sp. MH10]MEB0080276.1 DUF2790 domain-containing protein [Pseudomonas sp. MH10out]MEB0094163.1 DUF2790 domain-containing protein [Pseudomonas sp. CCI4.2]MEB0103370.1 DUF2790 domain-containing protein [Pseudomonas sp. CCI3.2]MEB0123294.1 DUF2790 domain-containing protein [Pseudomonas sp. CCI1.2]